MSTQGNLVEQIAQDDWRGRGHELVALLGHADPEVRSASAVRIAEIHMRDEVGLSEPIALLDALARADAIHPGVADAFWTTVQYKPSPVWDDDVYEPHAKPWMLRVLETRRDRKHPLSPVPGNDLEFYAHEVFDRDVVALGKLLDWGYEHVVTMALDHGALCDADMRMMLERLYDLAPSALRAQWLALNHGVVKREIAEGPHVTLPGAVSAPMIEQIWGAQKRWIVRWIFVPAGVAEPSAAEILASLGIRPTRATLDPAEVRHVRVPTLEGATWRTESPRPDIELRVATSDATHELVMLCIVQVNTRG